MRIAVINPKFSDRYNDKRLGGLLSNLGVRKQFTPNQTIVALAGMFSDFAEVDVIDEANNNIDYLAQYDLIGITSTTPQAYRAYEISGKFRKRGVPVILGGPHPTLMPEEASKNADSIFIGEAEGFIQGIVDDLKNNRLKQVYHGQPRGSGKPVFLKYNILKKLMEGTQNGHGSAHLIPIQIMRGCPYKCSFCAVNKLCGSKIIRKRIDDVLLEIEEIDRNFSLNDVVIAFQDDNVSVDKKYMGNLMDRLRQYKLRFACLADISLGEDIALLKKMREAGCNRISFGLETVNEKSIKEVGEHKSKYHDRYAELLKNVRDCGIPFASFFIFGWDNDTVDTFSRTVDFIFDNDISFPVFFVCTPLPKTDLEKKLIAEGRILEKDYWDKCNGMNVLYKPEQMTKEELEGNLYQIYLDTHRWELPLDQINSDKKPCV